MSRKILEFRAPALSLALRTVVADATSRPLPPLNWALLILFLALQVADVVTTNYALAVPGNWGDQSADGVRSGPFGAHPGGYQKSQPLGSPPLWCCTSGARGPIACAVSYYVLIVWGNLTCL